MSYQPVIPPVVPDPDLAADERNADLVDLDLEEEVGDDLEPDLDPDLAGAAVAFESEGVEDASTAKVNVIDATPETLGFETLDVPTTDADPAS